MTEAIIKSGLDSCDNISACVLIDNKGAIQKVAD